MAGLSQANIITLLGKFAHSLQDSTTTTEFMNAVLDSLAAESGPLVGSTTGNITSGTATYDFPTTAVKLLSVITVGRELMQTTVRELDHFRLGWRGDAVTTGATTYPGQHLGYWVDEISGRKFTLWPTPASGTTDGLVTVYTEARTTTLPEWYALLIVFATMAQEFAYPSDHQDKEYAVLCGEVALFLRTLLGV